MKEKKTPLVGSAVILESMYEDILINMEVYKDPAIEKEILILILDVLISRVNPTPLLDITSDVDEIQKHLDWLLKAGIIWNDTTPPEPGTPEYEVYLNRDKKKYPKLYFYYTINTMRYFPNYNMRSFHVNAEKIDYEDGEE